jgi:eukaryotic-like serine/threonine-protein kinase
MWIVWKSIVQVYRRPHEPKRSAMARRIGRYEIQAELGRGGFGQVFRAFDPTVGRQVAVKTLNAGGEPDLLTRFRNEAAAAGQLRHPNIVTIFDFGDHEGTPFMVMELLEGDDLQKVIAAQRPLTLVRKLEIMRQIADGLHHAHARGIVHRDVKPANVMLLNDGSTNAGSIKVLDFGIALLTQAARSRVTPQGNIIGTFRYMAPEQFAGAASDSLSDIFAYGLIFYELLTGEHPFSGNEPAAVMYNIMSSTPKALRTSHPSLPEALDALVRRCLAKDREQRYQTLEDVLFDIEPVLQDLRKERADSLLSEAQRLVTTEQTDAAQSMLREILELDATNRTARALRETIQHQAQKRAVRPRIEGLLRTGQEHLASRQYQSAVESFESALKLDTSNSQVRAALEQARAMYDQAMRVEKLLTEARHAHEQRNLTGAFSFAVEALQTDPSNSIAAEMLTRIRGEMESREREKKHREALSLAAEHIRAERFEQAIRFLTRLVGEFPNSSEAKELLRRAEQDKASKERRQRLEADLATANQLLGARKLNEAIALLDLLIADFPQTAEVRSLLDFARRERQVEEDERGRAEQARRQAEKERAEREARAEAERKAAEERAQAQLREEARRREEAKRLEEARRIEEARLREQARLAEEARLREQAERAEQQRRAEAQRQAELKAEAERRAEREREARRQEALRAEREAEAARQAEAKRQEEARLADARRLEAQRLEAQKREAQHLEKQRRMATASSGSIPTPSNHPVPPAGSHPQFASGTHGFSTSNAATASGLPSYPSGATPVPSSATLATPPVQKTKALPKAAIAAALVAVLAGGGYYALRPSDTADPIPTAAVNPISETKLPPPSVPHGTPAASQATSSAPLNLPPVATETAATPTARPAASTLNANSTPATPNPPTSRETKPAEASKLIDPKILAAQDWNRLKASQDPAVFDEFARRYASTPFAGQAAKRAEELRAELAGKQAEARRRALQSEWDSLNKEDANALRDFQARASGTEFSGRAANEIARIDRERIERERDRLAAAERAKQEAAAKAAAAANTTKAVATTEGPAIRSALNRFASAFQSKNIESLRTAWPSMPRKVASDYEKSFKSDFSFQVSVRPVGEPVLSGDSADVICEMNINTEGRGKSIPRKSLVRISLKKSASGWVIENIQN